MTVKSACTTASKLLLMDEFSRALELLERAVESVQQFDDWKILAKTFEDIPASFLLESRWAWAYSATLVGLREEAKLLEFSSLYLQANTLPNTAAVLSDLAWVHTVQDRYAEAQHALEQALPHLSGWRLGVAWRRLARCRFELGQEWEDGFAHAYPYLSGRLKALALMEEAYCWERSNNIALHRQRLLEALALLDSDPYHQAWVRHALGLSFLRELDPDAERHFKLSEEITRQRSASGFRSRALQGLGNFYRSRGEWALAEAAYQGAIRCALDKPDLRVAYWSLGRSYRLQRQYGKSLEYLQKSLAHFSSPGALVQADIAATLLAMGKTLEARSALQKVDQPQSNERWLALILQAEIARREGNGVLALQLLGELPCALMIAREEAPCWPELFEMARLAGQPVPEPLLYPEQTRVHIQALGTLRVFVNRRDIGIGPTSRVGELLVLLMENGGQASSEHLVECLWPGSSFKQKRQALWQLVQELRRSLGWPGSVEAPGRVIRLDPLTHWEYDLAEARNRGRADAPFLEGIYTNWAREIAEEVELLRGWPEHTSALN